ncbi:hypothetical protein ABC639_12960, partial [Lacticaseibacillus paracasei]
ETRKQAQKPAHKDPKPKWPRPGHLGLGQLMLRFLNAPVCALNFLVDICRFFRKINNNSTND